MLDTGRWSWMPVIDTGTGYLDAGDIGYWRYWMPEMPGVGAGDACCFIIVC